MENTIRKKITEIRFFHKTIMYILFGALWALSQIGYSFSFLSWFAFVPFIYMIKYENTKFGLFYSFIFGFTFYILNLWWMTPAISSILGYANTNIFMTLIYFSLSILILILTCVYHGLSYSIIFYLSKFISKNNYKLFYLSIPFITVVIDYFFPKIWHDQIGYSQFLFFHFSQIADIFGIPGISFLILLSNSAIIIFLEAIMYYRYIKRSILLLLFIVLLIVSASIYGILRYDYIMNLSADAKKAKIGLIQGNFTGLDKFDDVKYPKMIETYNNLSKFILTHNPDVIVWPESAIPYVKNIEAEKYNSLKYFHKTPLISGIILSQDIENEKRYYNSMVLISGDKTKIDHYSKIKLIPFAEKLIMPFIKIKDLNYFSKGTEYKIFKINKLKISPSICYEIIIPSLIRKSIKSAKDDVNLLLNLTNDSWFGRTMEAKMHLHVAGFRAIEHRKSLVRCASTGYSAYFNPAGDIIYLSDLFKEQSTVVEAPLLEIKTVYSKWGYLFIWFILLLLISIIIYAVIKKIAFTNYKQKLINNKNFKRDLKRIWLE